MISKIGKTFLSCCSRFQYGTTPQMMHDLSAAFLLDQSPRTRKRTKTICTIGYPYSITQSKDIKALSCPAANRLGPKRGPAELLPRRPPLTPHSNARRTKCPSQPSQSAYVLPAGHQGAGNTHREPDRWQGHNARQGSVT